MYSHGELAQRVRVKSFSLLYFKLLGERGGKETEDLHRTSYLYYITVKQPAM